MDRHDAQRARSIRFNSKKWLAIFIKINARYTYLTSFSLVARCSDTSGMPAAVADVTADCDRRARRRRLRFRPRRVVAGDGVAVPARAATADAAAAAGTTAVDVPPSKIVADPVTTSMSESSALLLLSVESSDAKKYRSFCSNCCCWHNCCCCWHRMRCRRMTDSFGSGISWWNIGESGRLNESSRTSFGGGARRPPPLSGDVVVGCRCCWSSAPSPRMRCSAVSSAVSRDDGKTIDRQTSASAAGAAVDVCGSAVTAAAAEAAAAGDKDVETSAANVGQSMPPPPPLPPRRRIVAATIRLESGGCNFSSTRAGAVVALEAVR